MDTLSVWLNASYIEETLVRFYKDESLKIIECVVKPALGKGENYGGILIRVNASYVRNGKQYQQSLIVKTAFEGDQFLEAKMKPYDIFNREMSIYENILPNIHKLLKEISDVDVHAGGQLFVRALRIDYERQALIFEDLSECGYVMADRVKRLDRAHVKLILRKLAKMHAASAVLNERTQRSLEVYDRGFFNRYTNNYSSYFLGTLIACANCMDQYADYKGYAQKLRALEPFYMEIGKRCFAAQPEDWNVLAHGDVWTNNVMFKYARGDSKQIPIDVIIIDFQYSFWGSPALDLHHLFNTSLQEDLRLEQQNTLTEYYYRIFANTLQHLNYFTHAVPTLHQFSVHVEKKRFFAFHSACVIQPVMINENSEDADFTALLDIDERALNFKNRLYDNTKVHDYLKKLLPIFDRRGLLDINQCD